MHEITPEIRAYIVQKAPKFIPTVEQACEEDADRLLLSLPAFAGEPDLLYCCLLYAYDRGVDVTFAPNSHDPEKRAIQEPFGLGWSDNPGAENDDDEAPGLAA